MIQDQKKTQGAEWHREQSKITDQDAERMREHSEVLATDFAVRYRLDEDRKADIASDLFETMLTVTSRRWQPGMGANPFSYAQRVAFFRSLETSRRLKREAAVEERTDRLDDPEKGTDASALLSFDNRSFESRLIILDVRTVLGLMSPGDAEVIRQLLANEGDLVATMKALGQKETTFRYKTLPRVRRVFRRLYYGNR